MTVPEGREPLADLRRERFAALRSTGTGQARRLAHAALLVHRLRLVWDAALLSTGLARDVGAVPDGGTGASSSLDSPLLDGPLLDRAPLDDPLLGNRALAGRPIDARPEVLGPPGIALAMVGSLARSEAGPASDVDLVLLHEGRHVPPAKLSELADALWYPLWDGGLRLDHSVRTIAACREVAATDLGAAVGLLDLALVGGDPALVTRTRAALYRDWRDAARRRLPHIVEATAERGRRHGELAHLLEPDLKEARGGLMDVTTLRALSSSWLTDRPRGDVDAALAALLDIRDAVHVVTGRPGNRLGLADQDVVASVVGDPDADELLARVAEAGRTVAHALDTTIRRARQSLPRRRLASMPRRPRLRPLGHGMVEHDGEIVLGSASQVITDPLLALRAAATAVRTGLPLSPVTVANLADAEVRLDEPWPSAARDSLLETLSGGQALVPVWNALDLEGLVSTWIPEWAAVRNRPQRNAVHRFTVDRHLVETCVQAQPFLREVSRPDLLLLACLLHDIGKLPGAVDHSSVGAPIALRIAYRLGVDRLDAEIVSRLVREHLTLIELATRRDPDDTQTVSGLVAAVEGRDDILTMLRVLTEADALATGPAAWSPWKARLVDDLVTRARAVMDGSEPPGPAPLTPLEESAVTRVRDSGAIELSSGPMDGLHVVTVIAPDRTGLFADIAGLLAAHRLVVRSALIRTVDDVAVDTWWVENPSGDAPDAGVLRRDLDRVAGGDEGLLARLASRDASYRPISGAAIHPRVMLVPGASDLATVVEVRALDRPGLLRSLGVAVAEAGIDIRSAHVATHAGQAVDVLYLSDAQTGNALSPPRVGAIIASLVEAADGESPQSPAG